MKTQTQKTWVPWISQLVGCLLGTCAAVSILCLCWGGLYTVGRRFRSHLFGFVVELAIGATQFNTQLNLKHGSCHLTSPTWFLVTCCWPQRHCNSSWANPEHTATWGWHSRVIEAHQTTQQQDQWRPDHCWQDWPNVSSCFHIVLYVSQTCSSQRLMPMQLANSSAGQSAPLRGPHGLLQPPATRTCEELIGFTSMHCTFYSRRYWFRATGTNCVAAAATLELLNLPPHPAPTVATRR